MTSKVRPTYTLPAEERLKSKKEIEELFRKSSSFFVKPILLKYAVQETPDAHKLLVVVPKKHFKKAVHRNLLKRRIREAYRLNKHRLTPLPQQVHLAFLFLSPEMLSFQEIQEKLIILMDRLIHKLPGSPD